MIRKSKKFCEDCGLPSTHHLQTWLDEFTNHFSPRLRLPRKIEKFFDVLLEKFFTFFGLVSLRNDFTSSDIQLRSTCFIDEFRKRGGSIKALRGPFGYTNHFRAEINDKVVRFEGLPIADFVSKYDIRLVDDKEKTKLHLSQGNFPIAKGKSFWFWQKKKALKFGREKLGFPLVVKPRSGSVSRHVTTNIQDSEKLKIAIKQAIIYSPAFIVERARKIQKERFKKEKRKIFTNAEMSPKDLEKFCPINQEGEKLLKAAIDQFALSGRAYHRILKVARTIADLEEQEKITSKHLAEAISYRVKLEEGLI